MVSLIPVNTSLFDTWNGIIVWTDPLPNDCVPIIIALLWSCSAPATISEAEADPPSIITTKGFPSIRSAFFALYLFISCLSLPRVDTISPLARKISVTFTAWVKSPPGFERTSNTYPDWYAEELRFELNQSNTQIDTDDIRMGDFLFFGYDARFPERYKYYDRRPLAFMLKVVDDNKILGYNIHYLNPSYRGTISESMLNKKVVDVGDLPEKGLHSYIIGNMSNIYRIPRNVGEYRDIAKLVTEDFVDENGGKYDINAVWDSVN